MMLIIGSSGNEGLHFWLLACALGGCHNKKGGGQGLPLHRVSECKDYLEKPNLLVGSFAVARLTDKGLDLTLALAALALGFAV